MEPSDRDARPPARRCCSAPKNREASRSSPSTFYAFPSTLHDILFGPRQRLTKYADGMQALPYTRPAATTEGAEGTTVEASETPTEAAKSRSSEATERQVVEGGAEAASSTEQEAATETSDQKPAAALVVAPAGTESSATEQIVVGTPKDSTAPAATDVPAKSAVADVPLVATAPADETETITGNEDGGGTITSLDCAAVEALSGSPTVVTTAQTEGNTGGAARTAPKTVSVEPQEACEAAKEWQRSVDAAGRTGAGEQESAALPKGQRNDEAAVVAEETSAVEEAVAEDEPAAELPQLHATYEMVAFDAAQIDAWMTEYRHETAYVPCGVLRFVRQFNEQAAKFAPLRVGGTNPTPSIMGATAKKGKKSNLCVSAVGGAKSGTGALADLPSRDSGVFGSSSSLRTGVSIATKKPNALEALGDVWEGRQEAPISLTQGSLRRRGLFGEVEKKEIHHMVVAVLNKVTTDPVKFREVKNELLRLPIPEANAEQMAKIVDAFFTKAVREQHFSHSYADLIVALCKVPQGQHIVGDKTQSLEYRLRMALLKRCQAEFLQSIQAEETDASSQTTGGSESVSSTLTPAVESAHTVVFETEKERRERMCGNVRFVCELFLRDIVAAPVISVIFRICCLGSEFGEFVLPPAYTPTESQVDEIITVVNTVKERYFVQSGEGRRMLPHLLSQLEYWVKRYTISRCRFVLMSTVDDLRAMLPNELASPMASAPLSVAAFVTPQLTHSSPTHSPPPCDVAEQGVVAVVSLALPPGSAASPGSAAADATAQLSMGSTMVCGQPLPAPRSKQVGSVSLSDSAGSINGVPPAEPPAAGSTRSVFTLTSRSLLQHVRPEAIAKLMATFSSGQCSAAEVAVHLFDTYGNVLPALGAWMDRCLSVVKEEKTRKQTGAVLVACVAQLTAHMNASSEEAAETVAMCREQLHEAAMEALQRAIEGKLYEDLHIFQFWAQLVLSDHARVVYDEELLNEGLELLVYTAPPAVRSYLVEVGKYMAHVLVAPEKLPWQASAETQNFVRYRPLLVLHSLVLSGGPCEAQALLDSVVGFSDVRQQSLELRLYHAFRTGSPSREVIFEQLRTSPRTTSRDPTLAAEVLSALLIAELCSSGDALVEDNMDLLQITVDGVTRAEREIAVVTEVYEILRYTPRPMTMSAAARVLRKLVCMHIVSDETMERADRFYEAERDGAIDKPSQEGSRALAAPPSADYPLIMDREGTDDVLLRSSASLRSVNGPATSNGNDNGNSNISISNGGGVGERAGSVDELQSSNASSFGEFRPRSGRPPRREVDSGQTSSRQSQRQLSPQRGAQSSGSFHVSRSGEDISKRLYRNSYKNRRRSQGEGGSERHSRAGGSKDTSPQQQPMGSPSPSSNYASSHDGSRHGGSGGGRYDRPQGSSRGGRGSGHFERGRGGSRGNGAAPHRGGGVGGNGGGISREDSRRGGGGGRYSPRPSGSSGGGKGE
ncbi:hypothetical protein LSCM4_07303 [Leishmania orientalis]|uniref:MIF4G domain-containing protein n=1 Tax=Leishmania orientalis TaxID=2249476 RepID=A0A836HV14_9TRYP|nr:hypothetical protein LSCM4_07303 [Leishmania orientalis]